MSVSGQQFQEEKSLTGAALALACVAICAANFMLILDTTIVAVSLSSITGSLSASPVQGTWIYTVYAVCMAVMLPLSGWLSRRFGGVTIFLGSVSMFVLTSWLCGLAPSFEFLVAARALQGFAGGLMMPLSQTLLIRLMPDRPGVAMSLWSMTAAVPPVLGPLLGGYITDQLGWEWIFYINIVPGLLILPAIWKWVRPFENKKEKIPVDRVGLYALLIGVICLQLFLDKGHEYDWLSSTLVVTLLIVAIVAIITFFIWEKDERHPIVDLSLFRIKTFSVATLFMAIFMGIFMVIMMLPPIWFQTVLGYTATWSGIVLAPLAVVPLILMPILGSRITAMNIRVVLIVGVLLFSSGIWMHGQLNNQVDIIHLIYPRLLMGLGLPFLFIPLMTLAYIDVPTDKVASATGLFNFFRMLAASMGTAIATTVWQSRTTIHRSHLVEGLDPESMVGSVVRDIFQGAGIEELQAWQTVEYQLMLESSTLGFNDVISACAVLLLLTIPLAFLLPQRLSSPEKETVSSEKVDV